MWPTQHTIHHDPRILGSNVWARCLNHWGTMKPWINSTSIQWWTNDSSNSLFLQEVCLVKRCGSCSHAWVFPSLTCMPVQPARGQPELCAKETAYFANLMLIGTNQFSTSISFPRELELIFFPVLCNLFFLPSPSYCNFLPPSLTRAL